MLPAQIPPSQAEPAKLHSAPLGHLSVGACAEAILRPPMPPHPGPIAIRVAAKARVSQRRSAVCSACALHSLTSGGDALLPLITPIAHTHQRIARASNQRSSPGHRLLAIRRTQSTGAALITAGESLSTCFAPTISAVRALISPTPDRGAARPSGVVPFSVEKPEPTGPAPPPAPPVTVPIPLRPGAA
jgi:hypothetical protein